MTEQTQPEKFDLRSLDVAGEQREKLRQLFPEVLTEGGKVDFERLKSTLGEIVDSGKERYGMNWPGKAECFRTIQTPSRATLRPCREESVNFNITENLIIEGDNLEVLKLLQKGYLGKVKMIYIDPPYNTGKDFIYPDNYAESLDTYLSYTGQVDDEGKKFSTNPETDGRFHSKWLNMMYPRLFLARNLLREDGVIFISIDEKEFDNLRKICHEIFGEENAVGIISWKNVTDNNPTLINKDNEFILCYAKAIECLPDAWKSGVSEAKDLLQAEYEKLKEAKLPLAMIEQRIRDFISDNEESLGFLTRYKNVDADGIYTGSESVHNPRAGGYDFEVLHPVTKKPMRKPANGYRFPEATFREMEQKGIILYGEDEKRIVKIKKYLADYEDTLRSVIIMDGRLGSYDLKRLFNGEGVVFTNPKPVELIKSLVSYCTEKDGLVLDFFGGSGTTAHAVMELNKADGGSRRFILVQLPEPTEKEGFATIADIAKERMRRVCTKKDEREPQSQLSLMRVPANSQGFRVFKLDASNFKPWDGMQPEAPNDIAKQLELHVDHVLTGRSQEDILTELLLKSGFALSTKVEAIQLAEKQVFSIEDGAMLICLDDKLTSEVIKAMADKKPSRVICLDAGFQGNDQLKTNTVQTMKARGVLSFRTV
jgi:adenine-specific DNA-methyltransferase